MGIVYKSMGKYTVAIQYLNENLKLEKQALQAIRIKEEYQNINQDMGTTLINLCSLYSALGKH